MSQPSQPGCKCRPSQQPKSTRDLFHSHAAAKAVVGLIQLADKCTSLRRVRQVSQLGQFPQAQRRFCQQQDRLQARLAGVLGAALFVVFFLGAGSMPGLAPERVVTALEPFVGPVIPSLGMVLAESGVFFAKLVLVVTLAARIRAASAALRGDQWMQETLRRLLPLAWANLLLLAALWQLGLRWEGGN